MAYAIEVFIIILAVFDRRWCKDTCLMTHRLKASVELDDVLVDTASRAEVKRRYKQDSHQRPIEVVAAMPAPGSANVRNRNSPGSIIAGMMPAGAGLHQAFMCPAVNLQCDTGHIAGCRRCQEGDNVSEFFRFTNPAQRNAGALIGDGFIQRNTL